MYDLSAISLISAPAANALSEPVIRMQPTSASASKASTAPRSSFFSVTLSAFKACGRLRRTIATRPRRSTMMVSLLMAVLGLRSVGPCCHGASRAESGARALRGERMRQHCQTVPALALTHRAKKRRSAALHHPLDDTVAVVPRAGFPLAVIDAEIVLEIAEIAIGAAVIA